MTTREHKKQAAPGIGPEAEAMVNHEQRQSDYTALEWFSRHGARFVRVATWNAKVNAPGKQPIEKCWQNKPLTLMDVLAHFKNGENVGLLCGKHSNGLCLLDLDDHLQEFLEYFPGLQDAPILLRRDAGNRGKIVLKVIGEIPQSKKWNDVHLEFLSTGNQGVIPPSIHPGGTAYELVNANNPPVEYDAGRLMHICEAWAAWRLDIESPAASAPIISNNGRGKPSRATRDFLEFGAGPHSRNNRLYIAACDLNGCGYSQVEAEWMLLPVWGRMSKSDKEAKATIASAYSQARQPSNPQAFDIGSAKAAATAKDASIAVNDEDSEDDSQALPLHASMPALPKIANLTDAEIKQGKKAGKFVDDYIAFAMKDAPMSPTIFHQTYALAILSTAVARRVFVSMGTKEIYPNLYIMLSAPSTLYTKTTGYKSAMKVLETAGLSHLLLPDGVTPQSLITELSNRPQENFQNWAQEDKDEWQKERLFSAQRAWWIDEASSLLSWFQQKHLAELKNIVLKFYECEPKIKVSTQIRGRETVRNIYLTICGPTTPAALRPHLKTPIYWTDGLFSRFLLVSPNTAPVRVFFPDRFPVPPALVKHVNQLMFERLETPKENAMGPTSAPPAIEAKITPELKSRWDKYHEAMFSLIAKKAIPEKLYASYGRFPEKAIKIAMLLAVSDWVRMAKGSPLVIQPVHWFRAQEITEGYRASLHRMIEDASMPVENEDDDFVEKIISRLQTSARNSRRELAQDLNMMAGVQRERLDTILNQLLRDEVLIEQEIRKERGPSTMRLFVKKNDHS
ncbi:MAG: DUF3987 domain-containing protein [Anaerolineales bacterium]|nr:DUF3987 domain-containing protein [Anaerolineales bacterium]